MAWYAALLVAVTATAIGYGIDAGQKELTHVFAGFYIAGCVAAVLAVRQEGLFTAIIQPPLILFCAVPGAYWLFHGGKVGHLKDLLINCGYPLIERFPLMLGTAGGVLLIGLARWYYGSRQSTAPAARSDDTVTATTAGAKAIVTDLAAKLRAILRPESGLDSGDNDAEGAPRAEARRRRQSSTAPRARRSARSSRPAEGSTSTRSRRTRQPADDGQEPIERPRRSSRRGAAAERDYEPTEASRRSRRRPRPETDTDVRDQPPRESRRDPRTRRSPYERPAPRSSRFDGLDRYGDSYGDRYDPPASSDQFGRYGGYEPSHEPRRRTPNGTHHPISQVRYRGAASPDEPRAEPRERRGRSRTQGRSQRRPPAESWEYDL